MQLKIYISIDDELRATRVVSTPCTIGRSKNLALTISHPAVSRKHCELVEEGGRLFLSDHGSLNGTVYKGKMVEGKIPLEVDDTFSIGEIQLRVELCVEKTSDSSLPGVGNPAGGNETDDTANTVIDIPEPNRSNNDDLRLMDD